MKLTKNLIDRDEALAIDPSYVAFVEGDHTKTNHVLDAQLTLKKGQKVLTFHTERYTKGFKKVGTFVLAVVSKVSPPAHADADGPVVRVTNGEYSWRVDGCDYAVPATGSRAEVGQSLAAT